MGLQGWKGETDLKARFRGGGFFFLPWRFRKGLLCTAFFGEFLADSAAFWTPAEMEDTKGAGRLKEVSVIFWRCICPCVVVV